jgi:hypothetical protein
VNANVFHFFVSREFPRLSDCTLSRQPLSIPLCPQWSPLRDAAQHRNTAFASTARFFLLLESAPWLQGLATTLFTALFFFSISKFGMIFSRPQHHNQVLLQPRVTHMSTRQGLSRCIRDERRFSTARSLTRSLTSQHLQAPHLSLDGR